MEKTNNRHELFLSVGKSSYWSPKSGKSEVEIGSCDNFSEIIMLSKETQTDFRENATQTYPWDPPYKISQDNDKVHEKPKVLSLENISFGQVITPSEIDYISRLCKVKKLRKSLESIDNYRQELDNKIEYICMMENQKQNLKLQHLTNQLLNELEKYSKKKERILQNRWSKKLKEMEKYNFALRQNLKKEFQKLSYFEKGQTLHSERTSQETKGKRKTTHGKSDVSLLDYCLSNFNVSTNLEDWLEKNSNKLLIEIPLPRIKYKTVQEKLVDKSYKDVIRERQTKLYVKAIHEEYERPAYQPAAVSTKTED